MPKMPLAHTVSRSIGDISLSVLRWPETPGSKTLPMNLYTSAKSGVAAMQQNLHQQQNTQEINTVWEQTSKLKSADWHIINKPKEIYQLHNLPWIHESCATWFAANICCDQPPGELPLKLLLEFRPPVKLIPPISPASGLMPEVPTRQYKF